MYCGTYFMFVLYCYYFLFISNNMKVNNCDMRQIETFDVCKNLCLCFREKIGMNGKERRHKRKKRSA